jgi:hypothetical protein
MKNVLLKTTVLFTALLLVLGSCSKKSDDNPVTPGQLGGKFKLVINDVLIAEETTNEVGMLGDLISVARDESLNIVIANVPHTVGGETTISDDEDAASVSISGTNILNTDGSGEVYFSISGTLKRESDSKVTFQGTCSRFGDAQLYTFSGYAESEAFKVI